VASTGILDRNDPLDCDCRIYRRIQGEPPDVLPQRTAGRNRAAGGMNRSAWLWCRRSIVGIPSTSTFARSSVGTITVALFLLLAVAVSGAFARMFPLLLPLPLVQIGFGAAIASEMYKNGEGTAPNPQKAAEWLAKAKELKAKQDQEEAKERKEETEYQAELHALEIIGEAGAKMFMNELRRSPECDVMCSQSDYSNGSCASRIQQRDSDLANHKINCDATIPEF